MMRGIQERNIMSFDHDGEHAFAHGSLIKVPQIQITMFISKCPLTSHVIRTETASTRHIQKEQQRA